MRKIIILAILLRVLVMPFYFHPDIKTYHFQASFLKRGVVNIYDYLLANKKELPFKEEFVYFPLTYLSLGTYQALISPLMGDGLDAFLTDASSQAGERIGTSRYLFFLKLPYLLADLGLAYLLTLFFKGKKEKTKVVTLWLLNPFTIVLFYVFSNIDILPLAISVWALYLASKNRLVSSALFLGLAAGFKVYPLLFLPFLFLGAKTAKERVLVLVLPTVFLLALTLPFWGLGFWQSAFVSGLTTRIFQAGFSLGFGEAIIPAVTLLTLFFLFMADKPRFDFITSYTTLFLLIFAFTHFHIQWLAWIVPFLVILIVRNKKLIFPITLLVFFSFAIPLLYADKFMTVSLLRAYSSLFDLVPTPFVIVQKFYDPYNLQSILHSLFAGASLFVVWRLLKEAT